MTRPCCANGDCPAAWFHGVETSDDGARAQWWTLQDDKVRARSVVAFCQSRELDWRARADAWRKKDAASRKRKKLEPLPKTTDLAGSLAQLPDDLRQEAEALQAEYEPADAVWRDCNDRQKALAATLKPRLGGDKDVVFAEGAHYSNQTNGETYQKGSTEAHADILRLHAIPCDVVKVCSYSSEWHPSSDNGAWVVVVQVEDPDVDLAILHELPGPSLVEAVRMAWKRGCNPRVFDPFLPHGFEDEHGLDYFGGRREVA